jgi:hypothetical protein
MLLNKTGTTLTVYLAATDNVTLNEVTTIGDYAFEGCIALTSVSLPAATSIGNFAFLGCTALVSVSLPAATSVGGDAFAACTALTSVSLPAATSIGDEAFDLCTALTSVSLGTTAPTLGRSMLFRSNTANPVTVRVPSGATGYGTVPKTYSGTDSTSNWGNGFRGGGWTGTGFVVDGYNKINTNITLNIVYEQ